MIHRSIDSSPTHLLIRVETCYMNIILFSQENEVNDMNYQEVLGLHYSYILGNHLYKILPHYKVSNEDEHTLFLY